MLNNQITYPLIRFDASKAARTMQLLHAQITVAEQIHDLVLSAYAYSGSEYEEVLRMQQQVLRYRLLSFAAIREHHKAVAKLDHITGQQLN